MIRIPEPLVKDVADHRLAKLRRIEEMCALLPIHVPRWSEGLRSDPQLRYAVAHHLVALLERATASRDVAAVEAALELRADAARLRALHAPTGSVVVAGQGDSAPDYEVRAQQTPAMVLGADVWPVLAGSRGRDLVQRALTIGADAGFGDLLSYNSRIVVMLREQPLDAEISSWTSNTLPGTVHMDYQAEPGLIARDLIHEAAHTALNDLIGALDVHISGRDEYYAPWLQRKRPPLAFLHGVWAFAHVTVYCAWSSDAGDNAVVRHNAAVLHARYSSQLIEAAATADKVLELLPRRDLAALLAQARDSALATR